ncbi:MAG TPA: hypothetical protein PKK69_04180, partial [Ferruginibacter sp.]|nr:hypothetical protein [Ferruginibacter sp.]
MKKLILSAILLGATLLGYSQSEYQKAPSIGVHFFANDFLTAADLRQYGLSEVIKNRLYSTPKRLN